METIGRVSGLFWLVAIGVAKPSYAAILKFCCVARAPYGTFHKDSMGGGLIKGSGVEVCRHLNFEEAFSSFLGLVDIKRG